MPTLFSRRAATLTLLGAAATLTLPARAQSAAFPTRPVKIVVGSSPGGPSDFLARLYGEATGPGFGQAFVVENRPGASGVPAADLVAKAAADGHMLLATGPASISVAPHLVPKMTYDPLQDLTPVAALGAGAFVLVVNASLPVRNVQELIALSKAKPDSLAYGSGGNGSSGQLCTELFKQVTGAKMTHVPYKGDGQAMIDLLSGQVQVMFTAPNVAAAHVKSGKLRLLGVTTRERVPSMADTPSLHEAGVPNFEYLGWIVLFAPAATPRPVLDSLAAAWAKAYQQPQVRQKLDELAMAPPERLGTRAAVGEFVRAEHARLGKLIRELNIKAE